MKTFYLITNVSGCKYWSYRATMVDADSLSPTHRRAVEKYGTIYINQNDGWFDKNSAKTIHKTVRSDSFPVDETSFN